VDSETSVTLHWVEEGRRGLIEVGVGKIGQSSTSSVLLFPQEVFVRMVVIYRAALCCIVFD
jgi:hypothetical protein